MWGKKKPVEEEKLPEIKRRVRKKEEEKEKPKPWGKGERYLLLFVLFLTIFGSSFLALMARSWKLPGLPRLEIPEEAFEETFVLEKENDPEEVEEGINSKKIIQDFETVTKNLSGVYGLSVVDLESGVSFGVHEDELFQAASLIKLPAMTMIYEQDEKKRISLESKYSLKEEDKVGGSGSLFYEQAGTVLTYRELVELMGQKSDNTAFNVVVKTLREDNFEDYISLIGMRDTSYETNMTTPKDIANFFTKLWQERLVNKENRDELLKFLTDTQYEDYLRAGIPEEFRVAHKYGREVHVINDAGIVYTEKPYVIVIMTKGVVESEAEEVFASLATLVHEGMTK